LCVERAKCSKNEVVTPEEEEEEEMKERTRDLKN
jgi:hypothetical protein